MCLMDMGCETGCEREERRGGKGGWKHLEEMRIGHGRDSWWLRGREFRNICLVK